MGDLLASDRESHLHTARVFLNEAISRRSSNRQHALFLQWAGNARRRAMACVEEDEPASQPDLFGDLTR